MTTFFRNIRLTPTEGIFLEQYSMNSGDVFYDQNEKTLVVFDGQTKGGFPLLKADLSNISGGGGGGAGDVDFGSKTLTAESFVGNSFVGGTFSGDGSGLTNLPIPNNLATTDYVDTAVANVQVDVATTTRLGTIKVGSGLAITVDGVLSALGLSEITSFSNLDSISFKTGVAISEFSNDSTLGGAANNVVPTEAAVKSYIDTSISNIDLAAAGTVSSGTVNNLAYYGATGNTVSQAGNNLTWNSSTNTLAVTGTLSVTGGISATTSISGNTVSATDLISGNSIFSTTTVTGLEIIASTSVNTPAQFYDGTGVFRLSSGSDIILDAPGDVNVNGSRITNIGYPIEQTDAVSKDYVDNAASQFTGGNIPDALHILATTASTSTSTGALIVDGGAGIVGNAYVGGTIFMGGSPVLTSLSGAYNGGTITGTMFVNNSTASNSTTSGALRVTGGVGIGGQIRSGGDGFHNGIRFGNGSATGAGANNNLAGGGGTGTNGPLGSITSGTNNIALGYGTLGQITSAIDNIAVGRGGQTNRTAGDYNISIGTSALSDNQGIGNIAIGYLAGSALATGDYNVIIGGLDGLSLDGLSNHVVLSDGQGTVKIAFNNTGAISFGAGYGSAGEVLLSNGTSSAPSWGSVSFSGGTVTGATEFTNNTVSTNASTGAVIITGGLGVGDSVYITGSVNSAGVNTTTLDASSDVTFTANTASTDTATGTLVVTGGVGVSGEINSAGVNTTTLDASSAVTFTANTASTTTGTGTLVVTGGVGVSGEINSAGVNTTTLDASSAVTFTANTASTDTATGTLVVTGGVGVSGKINVGSLSTAGAVTFTNGTDASSSTAGGALTVSGGLGVSGSIYAGSIQSTPIGSGIASTGAFTSITGTALTVSGLTDVQQITETLNTKTNATGTVVHDFATGAIWYHTTPTANFTANFTNVPTTNNKVTTVALIIIQGATARIPSALQINSVGQTIGWAGNVTPTGTVNRSEIFTFTLIRTGAAWRVLGSSQSY